MKCSKCGHETREGMLFCTSCGARIQPEDAAVVPEDRSEYRVVFERLNRIGAIVNAFVFKIDGVAKCRLKNGESKELRLSKGKHQVEISIFLCKSKKFELDVNGDRHIKCYYSTGKGMLLNPMLFSMIAVEDEKGVRL